MRPALPQRTFRLRTHRTRVLHFLFIFIPDNTPSCTYHLYIFFSLNFFCNRIFPVQCVRRGSYGACLPTQAKNQRSEDEPRTVAVYVPVRSRSPRSRASPRQSAGQDAALVTGLFCLCLFCTDGLYVATPPPLRIRRPFPLLAPSL